MIGPSDRLGLVGPNGTGKSTLFRAIVGQQPLDDGKIHLARDIRIGYLPQESGQTAQGLLLPSVLASVPGKGDLELHLTRAEDALKNTSEPDEQMRLAQKISDLHEQIDHFETEYGQHAAEAILLGLGFAKAELHRPLAELSGGWRMRALLAGLLFQKPDLLLLDEPTNHLDVPTVEWLDEFLQNFRRAIMLISHDRIFLNRQVNRVLSFEVEGLRAYSGNYDQYLVLRRQELEVRQAARRNQEAEIRQAEHFIRRFRAKASKARQVQSKIKKLKKTELIAIDHEHTSVRFSFPPASRTGKIAVKLQNIDKFFGELRLFQDFSASIVRGDRIAVIGRNGAGKTTLLRLMAGEIRPDQGAIEYGSNVEISYYAQHHTEMLTADHSILDEVWRAMPSLTHTAVRTICGAFLFSGDEVEKQVGVLSGGEKARVSLACLLVKPGNVLLMDEPTNHLDLLASEALAEALETYDGTLLFVSHNRAFIDRLANKIWDLENGKLEEFPGNLDDYLYHRRQLSRDRRAAKNEMPKKVVSPEPKAEKITDYQERKRINRRRSSLTRGIKQAEEKVAELEKRIHNLEEKITNLEVKLAKPETYQNAQRYERLLSKYQEKKNKIEELTGRWGHALEEIEQMQRDLDSLPAL